MEATAMMLQQGGEVQGCRLTLTVRLGMQMAKTGCDSTQRQVARPGAREEEMFHSPSARLFSVENELLKVTASALRSACCSLGGGFINGSSHSEQADIWLHAAIRNENEKEGDGGGGGGGMREQERGKATEK
ncbi:unnamed protein product [Pleuronectes platessa]|uniref:Uncharacterized protein n=1 Tax=Pleuronectes platessa TaxID=8262 RepID=A0A9N7ZDI9_PLEPL|nr:unnamed protein product [Pleuronectes platessa]